MPDDLETIVRNRSGSEVLQTDNKIVEPNQNNIGFNRTLTARSKSKPPSINPGFSDRGGLGVDADSPIDFI